MPFTPSYDFDTFATFEDPFSYATRTFEPAPAEDALNDEASPQQLDNKLLGFSEPTLSAALVDDMGKIGDMAMTAELYGMFFVAEDVFGADNAGRPLELTCYRRNLWQCSGQVTLPRALSHVVDDKGRQTPLLDLSATITGVESIEGKTTEIISIPWKNSSAQPAEESKTAGPPPSMSLDLSAAQEVDPNRVTLPFSWKRLQFKHATANNGRRKGLQQHYVVQISLVANAKAGEPIKIAEVRSGPVIVRGRSPRNFDSRRDVPLTGDKRLERRNTASSIESAVKIERDVFQANAQKQQQAVPVCNDPSPPPPGAPAFFVMPGVALTSSLQQGNEWTTPQAFPQPGKSPHPAKKMAISPTVQKPPVPGWSRDSNSHPRQGLDSAQGGAKASSGKSNNTSAPINLSLSEDERSPNRSSAEVQSPQVGKSNSAAGNVSASSPVEEADPLYEYFPLSIDDW